MENVTLLDLDDTGINDLPDSFCNLLRLWQLKMNGNKMCTIPNDLRGNNFTVLSESIQELRFLESVIVNDCKHLREIRGIPSKLKDFSALNCRSWCPWSTTVLLNQELHENGNTCFALPGGRIPRWFEKRRRGASISFCFRGTEFPSNALCLAILLIDDLPFPVRVRPIVTINGNHVSRGWQKCKIDQLFIFDLSKTNHFDETLPFENEWNHAEVSLELKVK
ncbi:hypothetical protein Ahy_B05g074398 [Arachis hypogaea]|uniref:TMV resistance protein N n=1 Tax=Arachis hypogaea TaxID=3818 RepID=A0A444YYS6_ARAHY|nr:hypothetical protein Ahy_B05g074398 [Arachis hypogaea]